MFSIPKRKTAYLNALLCASISLATTADIFDDLDAETTSASTPPKADVQQQAQGAFDDLESETKYGTQSKSPQELDAEFESWKEAYFAELENYKKNILKVWDTAEVTNKTLWVDYSDDLKTKKVVDYERNEIRISTVEPQSIQTTQEIKKQLENIANTNPNSARARDPVLKAINADTQSEDTISKSSIISEMIDPKNNKVEQQQKIDALVKSAKIEKQKPSVKAGNLPVTTVVIKLPSSYTVDRAKKYATHVENIANTQHLEKSLVYAIMHTESAFNPLARSHIPAFGLMQIVPRSAGRDAAQRIFGEDRLLSADYLFNAKNNIEVGSTYLNILYYSYLKKIKDPISRTYCTIAAYNTGAGNVSVAFTGNKKLSKAVPIINQLSPDEVYKVLIEKLPYEETRTYLKRVKERQQIYKNLAI